jgi:hypothetical protein
MQRKMKAVTSGKVFAAVSKPLREIEEIAKKRGVVADDSAMAELDAALAEVEAESEDEE